MSRVIYEIPNISCAHCVHTIQLELLDIEGIKSVIANADTKKVDIVYDAPADQTKIKNILKEINYPVKEE
jgi:copper chaperone